MPRAHEEASHHAKSATDDLKHSAEEIRQSVRDIGGKISEIAGEKFNDLRDQASDYYKKSREKASELEEGVEGYIQEKPVHALLIAAGIGLLVGLMWRRR